MMRNLDFYRREMRAIADKVAAKTGTWGKIVGWGMLFVAAIFTGTMTYSLTRAGMESNRLYSNWANLAALMPVILLEGSALALIKGRHAWFKSSEQRETANWSSWAIWGVLAATSIVHFAFKDTKNETVLWAMSTYATFILPVSVVAMGVLWKKILDAAPESQMQVAIIEAEANLRQQLIQIATEQNSLMVEAYRDALYAPEVTQARRALFQQAAIEHSQNIVGFIQGAANQQPSAPAQQSQQFQAPPYAPMPAPNPAVAINGANGHHQLPAGGPTSRNYWRKFKDTFGLN